MDAYLALEARFRRLAALREAAGVLGWDRAVVMPKGGNSARAEQLAAINLVCHEMLTDAALPDLMDAAESELDANQTWRSANLREMRRAWIHAAAVPAALVDAQTRATAACEMAWRDARAASDFGAVAPLLADVLRLTREEARVKAEAFGCTPYEALMDAFEPGMRTARIDPLFDALQGFLPALLDEALAVQAQRAEPSPPQGPFPRAAQRILAERMMATLGFDFSHGRLDESTHPFCGGGPDDVRITTRFDEARFADSLMGVLHETGHALYEAGLPRDWRYQPVGEARGMALHESQSLLIEMQACRSRAFMTVLAPIAAETFGGAGPAWEADNLYRLYTRVERGFIRVDADEVTYPLHVVLRYRLERAMVDGLLEVADLPAAWNDGMAELVGIVPPDDRRGCLQDIHWYDGAWGYFPTYTLGAMAAAQLFEAAAEAHPALVDELSRGDFTSLLAWLRHNVHGRASLATTDEVLEAATGRPLGVDSFERHLRARYL